MTVEIRDVAPGLWLWRLEHPAWEQGGDWIPEVASFAVESRGMRILLDPLAPAASAREAWDRIEAFGPEVAVVLKPDHIRDVDLFVRWYGVRALGPQMYWRDDVPRTELEAIRPGSELPAACRPSTTAAACTRRRSTSRSSARWSSPTP
jgi:hypothetical protein